MTRKEEILLIVEHISFKIRHDSKSVNVRDGIPSLLNSISVVVGHSNDLERYKNELKEILSKDDNPSKTEKGE